MPIEWDQKSEAELLQLIENHRRAGKHQDPIYLEALARWEAKRHKFLKLEATFALIRKAAGNGLYVTYEEVAEASETDFEKVHFQIGKHLESVCRMAHAKHWPLISSQVVNKRFKETGEMDPYSRSGFIAIARELGRFQGSSPQDETDFLAAEQQRTFDWARGAAL